MKTATFPAKERGRGVTIMGGEDKTRYNTDRMVKRMAGEKVLSSRPRENPKNEFVAERTDTIVPPTSELAPAVSRSAISRANQILGHVIEPAKQLPILARCEVLVVGGGPAGLSAAVASARAGADTVLVERYGCFGGTITTVGMETLGWYRYEGTVEANGLGQEMERRAEAMGNTVKFPFNSSPCLDADNFKLVADQMIRDSGVRPILHCATVDVLKDSSGQLIGVITESKSGRCALLAKRVIDCTGDADVAFMAGVPCRIAPKTERLGVTTVFGCSNVDKKRFLEYVESNKRTYKDWNGSDGEWQQQTSGKEDSLNSPWLHKEFLKAQEAGVISKDVEFCGSWSSITDAGEATNLNLVHQSEIDATNVLELTNAEMEGRRMVMEAIKALRFAVPGFENAKLRTFGMTIGIRDTRKICGQYDLTGEDVCGQARFEDSVGVFPEFVDGYAVLLLPTSGRFFQIPYRCLIPQKVDNLLVAGRCVAGDKISHAATRNMMCCCVTGQAAGAAAAVSVREAVSTASLDARKVQAELKRQGVDMV